MGTDSHDEVVAKLHRARSKLHLPGSSCVRSDWASESSDIVPNSVSEAIQVSLASLDQTPDNRLVENQNPKSSAPLWLRNKATALVAGMLVVHPNRDDE